MTSPVTVTDADRNAAAGYFRAKAGTTLEADCMEEGLADHWPLVQAFAHHAAQARVAALDEAAAEADDCWKSGVPAPEISRHILALKETPDAK